MPLFGAPDGFGETSVNAVPKKTTATSELSVSDVGTIRAALEQTICRSADWLVARIADDGAPQGCDSRNSWWRVPWALALAGRRDAGLALLSWVEREALDGDADLREGPSRGTIPSSPVYQLSHLAIGAQLLNRYDLADALARRVLHFQDGEAGGILTYRDGRDRSQDLLLTTQLGIMGLVMGRRGMVEDSYQWIERLWRAQPAVDQMLLYSRWDRNGLVTSFAEAERWMHVVDFTQPRQAYYHPGAAAAFLADRAMAVGDRSSLAMAREMMALNISGTQEQFTDLTSVQICKFGWGAAELLLAEPDGGWLPHALRMARWFIDRQSPDGSWPPATFQLSGPMTDLDRMWKTAEHLMESCLLHGAIASSAARSAAQPV
jgi:hypothetical protein